MRCERCGAYMPLEERTSWNGYILHAECVPKNQPSRSET